MIALAALSLSSIHAFASDSDSTQATAKTVAKNQNNIAQSLTPLAVDTKDTSPVVMTVGQDGKTVAITEAYLEKAPQFNLDIQVINNEKTIYQTSSTGISGIPVSISSLTTIPYIRESYRNEAGEIVNVPDSISSGYSVVGDVRPLSDGQISLKATINVNNLIAMQKSCSDGLCVELPSTQVNQVEQRVSMKDGQPHTFSGFIVKDGKRENVKFIATVTLLKPLATASNN